MARTGIDAPAQFVDRLYDSSPGIVISVINTIGTEVDTLLVIGHEPVMSSLALGLAGQGSSVDAVGEIERKYPTSAIAVLTTEKPWSALELGGAQLTAFHVPR